LNAFEFGDATAPDSTPATPISADGDSATTARERSNSVATPHNTPYLSTLPYLGWCELMIDLATFRMVVLADELLEGFFDKALAASFQLERSEVEDFHQANQKSGGVLGGLMNLVVNDSYVNAPNQVELG
jgi:hypothetical protein